MAGELSCYRHDNQRDRERTGETSLLSSLNFNWEKNELSLSLISLSVQRCGWVGVGGWVGGWVWVRVSFSTYVHTQQNNTHTHTQPSVLIREVSLFQR